jgi:flagellar protein FlaJ
MEQLPAIENGAGLPFAAGSVPVQTYRVVFFHSALLQAIGTGLLAGKLVDNDARSGLKYTLALVALAVLAFAFV